MYNELQSKKSQQFFDHCTTKVKEGIQSGNYLTELNSVVDKIIENQLPTTQEIALLGNFLFTVIGYEYISTNKISLEVERDIFEKLSAIASDAQIDVNDLSSVLTRIVENLDKISPEVLNLNFDLIFEGVDAHYGSGEILSYSTKEKNLVRELLNSIRVPINYSEAVAGYFKTDSYTAADLIKFNSLITTIAIIPGFAMKQYISLYSDQKFINALGSAIDAFNNTKYFMLYREIVFSLLERIHINSNIHEGYKLFDVLNNPELDGKTLEPWTDELESNENELEQESKIDKIQEELEENPFNAFFNIISEFIKIEKPEEIDFEVLKNFIERDLIGSDLLQGFSVFLNKFDNVCPEEYRNHFTELCSQVTKHYGWEYKHHTEIICSNISNDENLTKDLNEQIREIITLVDFETENHKTYLVQQLLEDSIQTWSHFLEIIDVLETCKISGRNAIKYHNLQNFIKTETNYEEIKPSFEVVSTISVQLQLIGYIQKFLLGSAE